MISEKLFQKNFTLMVIGQIISIFGNCLLRFALPLHILSLTGSPSSFGFSLAASSIPAILCAPPAGIIADRVNRRNLMAGLDLFTGLLILLPLTWENGYSSSYIITTVLVGLSAIQTFYPPAVQASIPLLVSPSRLVQANAVVTQVNALSGLLGPIAGGMLYGFFGIRPLIIISLSAFLLSSALELCMQIPHNPHHDKATISAIIRDDLQTSITFLRSHTILVKMALLAASFNLFFDSMVLIGLPYIITTILALNNQHYGFTQGAMSAGALCSGLIMSIYGRHFQLNRAYRLFGSTIFTIIPIGLVLACGSSPGTAYTIITICAFFFMGIQTIFSILSFSFIQKSTPNHLTGKVMACILALCACSKPIGQALFGFLFEAAAAHVPLIIFITVIINIVITIWARKVLMTIPSQPADQ